MLIDVSRLIARKYIGTIPTGIDKVCIEYVKRYKKDARAYIAFRGWSITLSKKTSDSLFDLLLDSLIKRKALIFKLIGLFFNSVFSNEKELNGKILLNVGHMGADNDLYFERIKKLRLKSIYMVHDLIPIRFPEYVTFGKDVKHTKRIKQYLKTSTAIITNSQDTLDDLKNYAEEEYAIEPKELIVAPLGIDECFNIQASFDETINTKPYFVMIGTIEPRKNHIMILNIWRELTKKYGAQTPKLIIIGARGWQYENVTAMLDRCQILKNTVEEKGSCSNAELVHLLKNAKALLFPSHSEGYGIPLFEALNLRTPVIASPLAVFKEFAGDIPEYIDINDSKEWMNTIIDFAQSYSEKRANALNRISNFKTPSWESHFKIVDSLIDKIREER